MNDRKIDELLKVAAQTTPDIDSALLDRVTGSLKTSMGPVRPILPAWLRTGGLALLCTAVALAGAAKSGFFGFQKLSLLERTLIFPALALLIFVAAAACVSATTPGSRRLVSPTTVLGITVLVPVTLFAFLFSGYQTAHLVPQGIRCLATGLLYAIPTALLSRLLLRRGFAVDSVVAGLAGGTLAGLAGLAMLELHCVNLQALHILLWHTTVVPLSAAAGAWVAWILQGRAASASLRPAGPR